MILNKDEIDQVIKDRARQFIYDLKERQCNQIDGELFRVQTTTS